MTDDAARRNAPSGDDFHDPDDDGWDCDCPKHNPSLYDERGQIRAEVEFLVRRSAAELMKDVSVAEPSPEGPQRGIK